MLRFYSGGVLSVISFALQVLFENNTKLEKLRYNDFLKKSGLMIDSFSAQTLLKNKNAFKTLPIRIQLHRIIQNIIRLVAYTGFPDTFHGNMQNTDKRISGISLSQNVFKCFKQTL